MYSSGKGIPKSTEQAYAWLFVAVANGYSNSQKNLADAEKMLSPSQLEDAKKLAEQYVKQYPARH